MVGPGFQCIYLYIYYVRVLLVFLLVQSPPLSTLASSYNVAEQGTMYSPSSCSHCSSIFILEDSNLVNVISLLIL